MPSQPFAPAPPRRFHPAKRRAIAPTPAPVLVSATYVAGESVTLTFDRAVNVSASAVVEYAVDDGPQGWSLNGIGTPSRPTPRSVTFELEIVGSTTGTEVRLFVPNPNGIVAADGGVAWSGVDEVALPFGE